MCVVCFFFKQKTAYEMRISDWSSDVCSSDLLGFVQDVLRDDLQHHRKADPLRGGGGVLRRLDEPLLRHGYVVGIADLLAFRRAERRAPGLADLLQHLFDRCLVVPHYRLPARRPWYVFRPTEIGRAAGGERVWQ